MVLLVVPDFVDEVTKIHDGGMTSDTLSAVLRKAVNDEMRPWDKRKLTKSEAAFLADEWPEATKSEAFDLAQQVLKQRRARTPIAAADADVQDPKVARFVWAKSLLLAIDAASEVGVKAFRCDVLDGQLLELGQVADWINEQAESDGTPTRYLIGDRHGSPPVTCLRQGTSRCISTARPSSRSLSSL